MARRSSGRRREEILQTLAMMLETRPGARVTTAALANELGVSEAALYRHFPSKARMFEGLIEFLEETTFSRLGLINEEHADAAGRCGALLYLLLSFCERNPGFSRLLTGDVLAGETERLRRRIAQFFDRMETEIRTILRHAELEHGERTTLPAPAAANLMLALAEGRVAQFVRSEFRRPPTDGWTLQWEATSAALFRLSGDRAAAADAG